MSPTISKFVSRISYIPQISTNGHRYINGEPVDDDDDVPEVTSYLDNTDVLGYFLHSMSQVISLLILSLLMLFKFHTVIVALIRSQIQYTFVVFTS